MYFGESSGCLPSAPVKHQCLTDLTPGIGLELVQRPLSSVRVPHDSLQTGAPQEPGRTCPKVSTGGPHIPSGKLRQEGFGPFPASVSSRLCPRSTAACGLEALRISTRAACLCLGGDTGHRETHPSTFGAAGASSLPGALAASDWKAVHLATENWRHSGGCKRKGKRIKEGDRKREGREMHPWQFYFSE